MGSILQGTIVWTGFSGAPGYTNLYTRFAGIITTNVDNMMTGMNKFCDDLHFSLPNSVHVRPVAEIKQFDEATGALLGLHTPAPAPVDWAGSGGTTYASPVGACISWGTGGINRGKRVRGRTFLVPLAGAAFDTDGTLLPGFLGPLNGVATNWRTSSAYETVVWSRPRAGAGGAAFDILSHRIADKAAVLRSRRD